MTSSCSGLSAAEAAGSLLADEVLQHCHVGNEGSQGMHIYAACDILEGSAELLQKHKHRSRPRHIFTNICGQVLLERSTALAEAAGVLLSQREDGRGGIETEAEIKKAAAEAKKAEEERKAKEA